MLPDVLTKDLNIVFCGTAKGEASARKGFYYAGPGNRFYGVLYEVGFTPMKLEPKDCYDVNQYNIGLTDLVHAEPKYIAFNGKKSASFFLGYRGVTSLVDFGLQDKRIGTSQIYILPSTSGSARRYWDESYWIDLYERINRS